LTNPSQALGARTAPRSGRRLFPWTYLGVVPFLLFALLFLVLPTSFLFIGSFQNSKTGQLTLDNFAHLTQP